MSNSLSTFFRDLGKVLHLPAALALLSLPVILYYNEWFALLPFLLMALVSLGLGQLFFQPFKNSKESAAGLSVILVALAWLLFPLLGTIALYGTATAAPTGTFPSATVFHNLTNCFFESMSGFTGTGLTMADDPSKLPRTLQWWRSLMEWIGGIGIIMLATMLLDLHQSEENLYNAETRDWTLKNASAPATIQRVWLIYLLYTAASVLAFFAGGMPFFGRH